MKCQRRIYSGISSSSNFPFEFANVPSLICLLTRGPSSWSAICISPVLSFAVSNKKTPICSFEQENLKSKKIQKKCCPTPKHCAAFNTGHAKRADDRKNLHWESCDICFNVFSQTMKKKRLHVSLRKRKFYQDTSFLSCTWFQCGNCSTSFNVGLEWCSSQYAAYMQKLSKYLQIFAVSMLLMQKLSKYLPKVKEIDPVTGKTLIGALKAI